MPGVTGWLWALFGWLLLPLALLDARHFWLPDRLSALLAIAGLLFAGPLLDTHTGHRRIWAPAGGGSIALAARAYRPRRVMEGQGVGAPTRGGSSGSCHGRQRLPSMPILVTM